MIKMLLCLLIIASVSNAESVVLFSTSFSDLPDGWTNEGYDEWFFGSSGAYASASSGEQYWFADLHSPAQFYFIPDGTDSVVVHIEHSLGLSGGSGAYATVTLLSIVSGNIVIYDRSTPYPFGSVYDNEPIHWSSQNNPLGTWMGISFYAFKEEWEMGNSINWHLYSLTITAYGNEMALDAVTWAAIKNSFQ